MEKQYNKLFKILSKVCSMIYLMSFIISQLLKIHNIFFMLNIND